MQYGAQEYVGHLRVSEVAINMRDAGAAWQNGYADG